MSLKEIVNTVEITNQEILEIGPGTGNLNVTYILKKKIREKFYVVEKDDNDLAIIT